MLVLLAVVDEGLAAGFAGADADGYAAFKREFGVPDEFQPVGFIPVGRPLPDKRSPSLARGWVPSAEFARWERW
jgi:nitroreductase